MTAIGRVVAQALAGAHDAGVVHGSLQPADITFTPAGHPRLDGFRPSSDGPPAALLTDNGAVFAGGPRRGKVLLETELDRLGISAKHSTPNHPQTCGKVERLHQTLKRYLACQPAADSLAMLQLQLDAYRAYYNAERPHRALQGARGLAGRHRAADEEHGGRGRGDRRHAVAAAGRDASAGPDDPGVPITEIFWPLD